MFKKVEYTGFEGQAELKSKALFTNPQPMFGDLFPICGDSHPNFPPTGSFEFERLADLQFSQVDDYFGVQANSDEGEDVPIWLYPLVDGEPVHHHPGPFDGVRLEYNVLRNPVRRAEHFLLCVERFAALGSGPLSANETPHSGFRRTYCRFGQKSRASSSIGLRAGSQLARTPHSSWTSE
jgi:hypothetical protein